MRLEKESSNYKIFVLKEEIPKINLTNKEETKKYLKDLFIKLKKSFLLDLVGFYEVNIYSHQKIGIYLELKKIEDYGFPVESIDLKIIINYNTPFFLEVVDYYLIEEYHHIYYKDSNYYLDLDLIKEEDLPRLLEYGNVIYGVDIERFTMLE